MFNDLKAINERPKPFQYYTAEELWTNEHTSKKMLEYHLDDEVDFSSRNAGFINRSVSWIIKKFNLNYRSDVLDFGCGPGLYTNRFAERGIMLNKFKELLKPSGNVLLDVYSLKSYNRLQY